MSEFDVVDTRAIGIIKVENGYQIHLSSEFIDISEIELKEIFEQLRTHITMKGEIKELRDEIKDLKHTLKLLIMNLNTKSIVQQGIITPLVNDQEAFFRMLN